eukprot:1300566-Rhodomonas_salina.1
MPGTLPAMPGTKAAMPVRMGLYQAQIEAEARAKELAEVQLELQRNDQARSRALSPYARLWHAELEQQLAEVSQSLAWHQVRPPITYCIMLRAAVLNDSTGRGVAWY